MTVRITQVEQQASKRYPWVYRVEFDKGINHYQVNSWIRQLGLPGVLMDFPTQGPVFYTTKHTASFCALKWA